MHLPCWLLLAEGCGSRASGLCQTGSCLSFLSLPHRKQRGQQLAPPQKQKREGRLAQPAMRLLDIRAQCSHHGAAAGAASSPLSKFMSNGRRACGSGSTHRWQVGLPTGPLQLPVQWPLGREVNGQRGWTWKGHRSGATRPSTCAEVAVSRFPQHRNLRERTLPSICSVSRAWRRPGGKRAWSTVCPNPLRPCPALPR